MPLDETDLETLFSSSDYLKVRTVDSIFVDQTATAEYSVFLFKNQAPDAINPPNMTCVAKSSLAPTISTVYLQVYNLTTSSWETLTSNSVANADTPFTMTASLTSGLDDHRDVGNWYYFRVYQLQF